MFEKKVPYLSFKKKRDFGMLNKCGGKFQKKMLKKKDERERRSLPKKMVCE